METRTVKPKVPARLVVAATLIGLLVAGFIIFATSRSIHIMKDARMTGTVTHKEFVPAAEGEKQIRLGRDGSIATTRPEGEFLLTVEVPQPDGSRRPFTVWLPNRKSFDAISIGDSFDVGPYLAR